MGKKLEEDFEQATDQNLPVVDALMLGNYFASPAFLAPEFRHVKSRKSARASYSDNAVAWVQVKRDDWLCHVRGQMTPETSVHSKSYSVHCLIHETDFTILKTICENCAASQDLCKHQIAFICWLHRRSEEPPRTSVACYWKKSVLSTVGSTLKSLKIETIEPPQVVEIILDSKEAFFSEAAELCSSSNPSLMFSHMTDQWSYALFHLMTTYVETPGPHCAENFIDYCKTKMTEKDCESIADKTVEQSSSSLWFEMRQGRLNASRVYEASRCSTEGGALVDSILGAVKLKSTKQMERGKLLEPAVLKCVTKAARKEYRRCAQQMSEDGKKRLLKKARNLKMRRTGLLIKKNYPVFGASPDGLLGNYVIEVKCPSTRSAFKKYFVEEGSKPAKKFKGQMQLQMFLSGYKKGLYCVADPKFEKNHEVTIIKEVFDQAFCDNMMSRALKWWSSNIYPSLYKAVKK